MVRTIRYVSRDARRVLILLNAKAGACANLERVEDLRRRLERDGMQVEILTDLPALAEATRLPYGSSHRAVVAAGGDGTVSAVVNHTSPEIPITVLPLGTENLLAKYLKHPFAPAELSDAIVHGASVGVDAGLANRRLFLLMAGCGFDADVVHRLQATRRGHIRHSSYILPILASIRRYEYPELKVYCDAVAEAGQGHVEPVSGPLEASTMPRAARWVFVVNLPKYAGGLRLVPDAVGNDGLLDVCLFRRGSLLHGLRYFTGVVLGRHRRWEDFSHVRVRKLRIESDREVPYQLDGDPGGVLPLEISVLPGRVRMVVTETWALQHGYRHVRQPVTDSDAGDGCPDS